ncbi:MAG: 5'/3'-nucleotidase SurE [Pseudomonadota bacterium]
MRILITNDDGITAHGLDVLEAIARGVGGPSAEIWRVAPAADQSGVGHTIAYQRPVRVIADGPRRVAVDGSPADCVLVGVHDVMTDGPPDLVLSGVNRGNNAAESVLYSGTVGAAMEAALQGLPAIALSQYWGPGNANLNEPFEAAVQHGADVVKRLLTHGDWTTDAYRIFYNVNFPPVAGGDVKGTRAVRQGFRNHGSYRAMPMQVDVQAGRRYVFITGVSPTADAGPNSDAEANVAGYISVTPLRADLTAHDTLAALKAGVE